MMNVPSLVRVSMATAAVKAAAQLILQARPWKD